MDWNAYIDAYCERLLPGLVGRTAQCHHQPGVLAGCSGWCGGDFVQRQQRPARAGTLMHC